MYGVSPAYFISRFTDRFSCREVSDALPDLKAAGFDAFQTEVFHTDRLAEWCAGGARQIRQSAVAAGLETSQFVGHFLLHGFETPEALVSDFGIEETARALDGVSLFPECRIVTVPLAPFQPSRPCDLGPRAAAGFRSRLIEKLGRMLDLIEQSGRRMALELIPGNLIGSIDGFLRLRIDLGRPSLGYNLDTGYAWTMRTWVPLIPALVGDAILGTHLKDNVQDDGAVAPGHGSVPWQPTFIALREAGYAGSLDIEFRCRPEKADRAYRDALATIRGFAAAPT
jgi:sugar phosphate isomerase/epimerase